MDQTPAKPDRRPSRYAIRRRTEAARKWILDNPRATVGETMKATGISASTVNSIRRLLVANGIMPPYPGTSRPRTSTPQTYEPAGAITTPELLSRQEARDIEAVLAGTAPLSRDERRKKLEALVRVGAPDHVIRANEAIEKMDQRDGMKEEIGPVPPSTLADGVDEVTDMIEALAMWGGEEAVQKAVTRGLERYYENQRLIVPPVTAQPDLLGAKGG